MLSFKGLRRLKRPIRATKAASTDDLNRIAWGVQTASRFVPGANCLIRVIAAQYFLAGAGHHSQIRIGVAKDTGGRFLAHAWLISGGLVVIGGSSAALAQYTRLADLDPELS
jgi:hypothetical protein